MTDDLNTLRALVSGVKTSPTDDFNLASGPSKSKLAELGVITEQRVAALKALSVAKQRDAESWSSQLGVRNTPVVGSAVDLAASFVSGTSRQISNLRNLPNTALNLVDEFQINDEDKLAILRFNNNTATEKDKQRLFKTNEFGNSIASRYLDIQDRNKESSSNANYWDASRIVNQNDRNELDSDLSAGWQSAKESFNNGDAITGVAKLIYGAGKSVLTNPKAVGEYVAENAPQLLLGGTLGAAGKTLLTATNVGYAADEYRKGVETFMTKNNGALPSDSERNLMAVKAASLALAENVGELGQLGAITKAKKSADGFLKTVAKATGTGALGEGLTEAYQTAIENDIQGKEFSGEDVYKAGVIGAASGGTISGASSGLVKGAEIAVDASQRAAEEEVLSDAVKTAIETGDTSLINDPTLPTYAPHRVVDVAIARAEQNDLTTEEKTATFDSLNQIRSGLEAQKKEIQTPFEPLDEVGISQAQEIIAQTQEELSGVEAQKANFFEKMIAAGRTEEEATTKLDSIFGETIQELQTRIKDEIAAINKKPLSPEEVTSKVKEIDDQLSYLSKRRNDLGNVYSRVKPETVNTLVDEVAATQVNPTDTTVVEESVKKASKIITFAMANTDNLSVDQAKKLASSEVGTTQEQRTYFALHAKAKEAELAAKDIKGVSANVFKGDSSFVGLDAYRRDLSTAVETNNKVAAEKLFTQLENFSAGHMSKLKAMYSAANNKTAYIVKDELGKWTPTNDLTKEQFTEKRKTGSVLEIGSKSINLVSAVKAEAVAIKALVEESRAGLVAAFKENTAPTSDLNTADIVSQEPIQQTAPETVLGTPSSIGNTINETTFNDNSAIEQTNQANFTTTEGIENGTQTFETKQTEAQGPEQQQGQANVGETYFASSEGDFSKMDSPDLVNLNAAISNGNTIVTDETAAVATYLDSLGYSETSPNTWTPITNSIVEGTPVSNEGTTANLSTEQVAKEEKPKNEGKISTLGFDATGISLQQLYDQGKFVSAFITQKGKQLPLVQVKDLLSKLVSKEITLTSFLKDKSKVLNAKQQAAIDTLQDQLPEWARLAKAGIVKTDLKGLSVAKDLFQQLINEDGSVDENVTTAIAIAGTMYVARYANYIKPRTYEEMSDMTFVSVADLKKYNDDATLHMLSNSVTTLDAAQIEMGRIAADLLGLTAKDKNVPENILPQLSAALGVHVFNMLSDPAIGVLETADYKVNEKETTAGTKTVFGTVVTFKRDAQGNLHEDVTNLRDTFNNTDNIVERAFGSEFSPVAPTTEPVKFDQKFTQGTSSQIPTLDAEQAQRDNDTPMFPIKDMVELLDAIGNDTTVAIGGAESIETMDIPANQQEGAKAKKKALTEEILLQNKALAELHADSENDLYELPFHTSTKVLSSQRLLIETRLNPMTSKIHRWSFSSGSWKTTITKDTPELIEILKISIASGLGLNADTNYKDPLIDQLDSMAETKPDIKKALELLDKFYFPEKSEDRFVFDSAENKATLVRATESENMQSLRALVSWTKLRHAIKTEFAEPLITDQMFGIDGKVNGTALAHISLGIADMNTIGPQTGFYPVSEEGPKNFVDYANMRGLDVYQNVFTKVNQLLSTNNPPKIFSDTLKRSQKNTKEIYAEYQKTISAITLVTGKLYDSAKNVVEKAGRDMVKEPITALHFGSAVASVRKSVGGDFINSYYKKLRKLNKEFGGENTDEAINLINAMRDLGVTSFPKEATLKQLMSIELTQEDLDRVKNSVEISLGGHVGAAFEIEFGDYLSKRDSITNATGIAFAMYRALKEDVTQAVINEGMADGSIAVFTSEAKQNKGKKYPFHDLSTAQKEEVNRRIGRALPMMHTVLSKRDGNIKAGLFLGKNSVGLNRTKIYENQVSVKDLDGSTKTVRTPSEGFTDIAPGATPASAPIHSLESAIMQTTRAQLDGARNINDEIGVGIGQAKDAARLINKQTADLVFEYSPLVEVLSTVTEIATVFSNHPNMVNMLASLDKNYFDEYAQTQLGNYLIHGGDITTFVTSTLRDLSNATLTGEVNKYSYLSTLGHVDQYPMEGAQYDVPQEYRDEAIKKSTAYHIEPLLTKVDTVLENLSNRVNKTKEDTSFSIPEEKINTTKLGKILNSLGNTLPAISRVILKDLEKILPKNLEIKTVSETTKIEGTPSFDTKAWFSYDKATDANTIYIVEGKSTAKALPETIYHELIHAALFKSIDAAAVSKNPELKNLHEHLERIRSLAMAKDTTGTFTQATVNNHELVSWGLANAEFRKFLSTIGKSDIPVSTGFPNLLKEFIAGVLKFLMPKTFKDSAVKDLLEITVGLIADAKANPNRKVKENTTLAMVTQGKQAINSYTTFDIFNALGTAKPGFSEDFNRHLNGLLSGIVRSLRGPFGSLTQAEMTNQTITPLDVWTNSVVTGKAPLVSKLSKSRVRMTAQERFVAQQVEVVINDAMSNPDVRVSAPMQELIRLFNSAKAALKPQDFYKGNWNKATQQNKEKAQALYDFMFNVKATNGKSDYLGNFVALGLSNEKVNAALNISAGKVKNKDLIGKNLADTLTNVFEYLLNLYTDLASKTNGNMQMNEKLYALTTALVNIEAKKKNVLKRQLESRIDPMLDAAGRKMSKALRGTLAKLLKHPIFAQNKYSGVRFAASTARIVLEDRVPVMMDAITKMRNEFLTQKHGLAMNMFNDVKGYSKRISAFIRMATSLNAEREHLANQLSKVILKGFENTGEDLTADDHAAITGGLLRTGAHVLIGKYDMKQISEMLADSSKLNTNIKVIEQELIKRFRTKGYYFIHQSKGLAALMVKGNSVNPVGQLTNALMISREANGSPTKLSETEQKDAELMIDEISSLYALQYRELDKPGSNAYLAKLIDRENARGEKTNGILEVMSLQAKLNDDVKNTLFSGSEVLMRKGYLPEIINPHTSFEIGDTDSVTAKDYADRGYEEGMKIYSDPNDPTSGRKAMYVLRDGAPSSIVSGAIQLDSNKAKGSKIIGDNRNLNSQEGIMNASDLAKVTQAKLNQVVDTYSSSSLAWNPMQTKDTNFMIPLFNENMGVVNWRYEMSHDDRDAVLERDNRVNEVISTMAATTFGKETAAQQNKAVVNALHEDYKKNYNLNSPHFIYISPLSEDSELRDIWKMLPYQMKQDIKEVTGDGKGMWVRKQYVLPVFGYRKYSLSEIWTKEDKLNMVETAFKTVVEWLLQSYATTVLGKRGRDAEDYAKRAYIYVRRGQRAWEEVVAQVKDIVVIRTGTVMLGNIISNFSLLKANGVPFGEMIKNHHVAIKAYRQYDQNVQELFELETEKGLGFLRGDAANKESRINQLQDAVNNSPIKRLIDAGLRPSIVEDLADIDDQYSYKSAFVEKMDQYVNKVNPTIRNVANQVLVTKNSGLYKALSKTTQMSDFVARYVLFEHLTKRKDSPMTEQEAIFEVSEAFINYDIPMAKGLQFVDDMGFTPFIKYFFRIQRVLLKTAKDHPVQMMSLVALNHFYSSLPLVTDSSFISHIGNNPFRSGAGQIFNVWDDTLVLDQLSKLVR